MIRSNADGNAAERVLHMLETTGRVSPAEAMTVHGIQRLAPRILELRDDGVIIDTRIKHDPAGRRYTSYELVGYSDELYGAREEAIGEGRSYFGSPLR